MKKTKTESLFVKNVYSSCKTLFLSPPGFLAPISGVFEKKYCLKPEKTKKGFHLIKMLEIF